jgi:hypothetical protein
MPQAGFETTTPVFERTKTLHSLDRAVTVIVEADPIRPPKEYKRDTGVNDQSGPRVSSMKWHQFIFL